MVAIPSFDSLTDVEQFEYVREHRTSFVGRLLIGVLSTGIYCLPTCTARQPKIENVRFFRTESDARAAGLRPCRRCRPDYFYRDYDPDLENLTILVGALRREPHKFAGLDAMVDFSGIGATKLHALFRQHYHTTPAAYLGRARLAAACALLSDPDRQVIDVAYEAGYESLSAFHDNFRRALGLSPRDYQRLTPEFTITLPENYLPWVALKLLARDPDSPTERVSGNHAVKALNAGDQAVLVHMDWDSQDSPQIRCRVESAVPLDTPSLQAVHAAVIRMAGLAGNPAGFERQVMSDPALARLVSGRLGLRIPLSAEPFEGVTWAIIGQQVNLTFACKLRRVVTELAGRPVGGNAEFRAHPTAEAVARLDYDDLTPRQFSRRKAEYLIDTARLLVSGKLALDPFAAASQVEKQFLAARGLGPWSVNYIMLRAFGFADCLPLGDTGVTSALQRFYQLDHRPGANETAALMAPFAPYRSLATYHLWMSAGDNPL